MGLSIVPFRKRTTTPASRDVASAVRAGQRRPAQAGRLIVVGGGKGGTGKSLLAANLAVLGSLRDHRVVLVDADLGLANQHLLLGVEPESDLLSLLEPGWSSKRARPDLLRQGPAGVWLLPGASGVERLAGLNRGELRRLVHRLEPYLQDGELLFIDLSSGISPSTQLFLRAAQEVIVVANPEPSAMLDAYGVIKLLTEGGHAGVIHLIMNRAHDLPNARECGQRMVVTVERFLGRNLNFLGCVPEDEAMLASVQRRRPLVLYQPDSPAAAALRMIAQQLLDNFVPRENTILTFFSAAKALVAPRRRTRKSSCAL